MTAVLARRGGDPETHRGGGGHGKSKQTSTGNRDRSDAAISQGTPGVTRSQRGREGSSPRALEVLWPCSHLDFVRLASRAERINF